MRSKCNSCENISLTKHKSHSSTHEIEDGRDEVLEQPDDGTKEVLDDVEDGLEGGEDGGEDAAEDFKDGGDEVRDTFEYGGHGCGRLVRVEWLGFG